MPPTPWQALLVHLRLQQFAMVRLLGRLVECESPSSDKPALDRLGRILASEWRKRGARVQVLLQRSRGNHLRAELWLGRGAPRGQILVLGHLDTVYDLGTLRHMPFRIARGRAWGPGTFDMKSGLTQALFAVDGVCWLRRRGIFPRYRVVFLWTSDEEIGSGSSRRLIECEARRSRAVFVLEPASGSDGRLKTSRKGVGEMELTVIGRSSHAGINPQDGVNAVHELAIQISRIRRFNDPRRGTSVNVDVVEGGTRPNVIAAHARALVDVRVARLSAWRRIERRFHTLRPAIHGARLEVRAGINRPPLERTAGVVRLFRLAQRLGGEMGFALEESGTGGGSDGNFAAALGVPTLDGLGGVGEGAHSPEECVLVRSLPERAALLAALLASV